MVPVKRYLSILVILAAGAAAALPIQASAQAELLQDMVLGKPDAPVTIIEYASLACSHCASFHENTLPRLKAEYIDTGKVRLVFRDFPFEEAGLRAAMLARCSGPDRYFGFVETIFRQQRVWAAAPNPVEALGQIGRLGGIGEEQFRSCLANRQIEEYILKSRLKAQNEIGVTSTPTFIIGTEKYPGARSFEEMKKLIDPLLTTKKSSTIGDTPIAPRS
jgi:protein-disulfide isomerase